MTTGMRRPSVRAAATWMLFLTVALAACAPAKANPAPVDPEAGRLYAQCMRANGMPDFPDPDAEGRLRGPGHEAQDDPKFKAAAEACRALAPGGEHRNTNDPAALEQMRKFSQCMRDNGLPDFPDPDADGRLRGLGHEAQDTPTYRAAIGACSKVLPGAGAHR